MPVVPESTMAWVGLGLGLGLGLELGMCICVVECGCDGGLVMRFVLVCDVELMGEGIESKLLLSKVEDVVSNKELFNFTFRNKDNNVFTFASKDQAVGALPPI